MRPADAPAAGDPIASLDGIRAVAVGLVFLAHAGLEDLVPGGLGVTIFFVLSGYLITTLMRVEHARTGALSFRAFYLRRALRLMPPLVVVVALAALLSELGLAGGRFRSDGLLSVLFYVGNYHMIADDFAGVPAGLGVMWSLAVEEHFYLFYPPLALLLLRAGRRGLSAAVLAGLCVVVLAWRCVLAANGAGSAYITMATDTRVDAILVGCLLGLLCNPHLDGPRAPRLGARGLALAAACGGVLLATLLLRDETFRLTGRYTVQTLAIAPLIYLAVAHSRHALFAWLSAAPVAYIGRISYTIYLVHHLLLLMAATHLAPLGAAGAALVALTLTLAVAEGMRRWVEAPCARLRQRLHDAAARPSPLLGQPTVAS